MALASEPGPRDVNTADGMFNLSDDAVCAQATADMRAILFGLGIASLAICPTRRALKWKSALDWCSVLCMGAVAQPEATRAGRSKVMHTQACTGL